MTHFLHPILQFPVQSFCAFLISALIVRGMIFIAIHDHPLERSSHVHKTPTAGGIGIVVSFVALCSYVFYHMGIPDLLEPAVIYTGVGVVLLAIVGVLDDYREVSYRARLMVQIFCAGILVSAHAVLDLSIFGHSPTLFAKFLSFIAIIGLINAANFIDGLNGLLSGSVLIAIGFSAFILNLDAHILHLIYAVLWGSLLGFYIFNFPRARIFMGDVGSTFLGYILIFMALSAQKYYSGDLSHAFVNKGFIYTLTPLAFLWFDVGFTLLRRLCRGGVRLTQAHREHMIHLLNDVGYSHTFVSVLYYISVVLMGSLTLMAHQGLMTFLEFLVIYIVLQTCFCVWVFAQKNKGARHKLDR